MYDYKNKKIPFRNKNIKYLYCVSKYPASLSDIEMPDFTSFFSGYSDHTIGISAVLLAISEVPISLKNIIQIVKHLTQVLKWHVCSMNYDDLKFIREYTKI